jgi:hypothetical protein
MPEPLSRYFRVEPDAYEALTQYVDTSRGFPNETTQRGLQLFEWLPHEEDGWGIIAIDGWRFVEDDEVVITAAIEAGTVEELDRETYWAKRNALRNPPEPEPEEPEEPLFPDDPLFDLPD